MPMLRTEQSVAVLEQEHPNMPEFWRGQFMTIICINDDRKRNSSASNTSWYLHDDSHIWLFHLSGHGLVPLRCSRISEGPLYVHWGACKYGKEAETMGYTGM